MLAGAIIAAAIVFSGNDAGETASDPSAAPSTTEPSPTPAAHEVKGQFSVQTNDWFETIPNTTWNRCDGEPECDGEECYGTGAGEGLGFDTEAMVTNAAGTKVAKGSVTETWGWERGTTKGVCVLYWSVEVPETETGVLTVTFDGNPNWAVDFTLAEMKKAPHSLDFISIGDVNSCRATGRRRPATQFLRINGRPIGAGVRVTRVTSHSPAPSACERNPDSQQSRFRGLSLGVALLNQG